jgi:hypothetical protein
MFDNLYFFLKIFYKYLIITKMDPSQMNYNKSENDKSNAGSKSSQNANTREQIGKMSSS